MNTVPQNTSKERRNTTAPTAKESQLTLELLQAIEQRDDISQRHIAQEMGVALGLANSYLKRCVKKGWVKVTSAPANRYLYYLTPNGFAEKARLTAEFFSTSLALFRQSGDEYTTLFEQISERQSGPIVLIGLSDLTEIALMRALQKQLPVIGVYQPASEREEFFSVPVLNTLPNPDQFSMVVFTSMEQTNDLLVEVEAKINAEKILIPPMLLKIKFRNPELAPQSEPNNDA